MNPDSPKKEQSIEADGACCMELLYESDRNMNCPDDNDGACCLELLNISDSSDDETSTPSNWNLNYTAPEPMNRTEFREALKLKLIQKSTEGLLQKFGINCQSTTTDNALDYIWSSLMSNFKDIDLEDHSDACNLNTLQTEPDTSNNQVNNATDIVFDLDIFGSENRLTEICAKIVKLFDKVGSHTDETVAPHSTNDAQKVRKLFHSLSEYADAVLPLLSDADKAEIKKYTKTVKHDSDNSEASEATVVDSSADIAEIKKYDSDDSDATVVDSDDNESATIGSDDSDITVVESDRNNITAVDCDDYENDSVDSDDYENDSVDSDDYENDSADSDDYENDSVDSDDNEFAEADSDDDSNENAAIDSDDNSNAEVNSDDNSNAVVDSDDDENAAVHSENNGNAAVDSNDNDNVSADCDDNEIAEVNSDDDSNENAAIDSDDDSNENAAVDSDDDSNENAAIDSADDSNEEDSDDDSVIVVEVLGEENQLNESNAVLKNENQNVVFVASCVPKIQGCVMEFEFECPANAVKSTNSDSLVTTVSSNDIQTPLQKSDVEPLGSLVCNLGNAAITINGNDFDNILKEKNGFRKVIMAVALFKLLGILDD